MKNRKEIVGSRIKKIREKNHYNIKTLAGLLGMNPSVFSQIEAGKATMSMEYLYQFCSLLDVSPDYIMNGDFYELIEEDLERDPILEEKVKKILVELLQVDEDRDI